MTRHTGPGTADTQPTADQCRPLRRDAELNRQKILRSAAEVFATRGLSVTLDDIAEHAGVGVGTVYRRFPSKDALVEALFEHKIDEMVAWAQYAVSQPDAWGALIEFLRAAVGRQAEDRGLRQVLQSSGHGERRVALARSRLSEPLSTLIEAAKRQGRLRADFQLTDVPVVMMMISSVAQYAGCADSAVWQRYLAMFIDGMRDQPGQLPAPCPALTVQQLNDVMGQQGAPAR